MFCPEDLMLLQHSLYILDTDPKLASKIFMSQITKPTIKTDFQCTQKNYYLDQSFSWKNKNKKYFLQ